MDKLIDYRDVIGHERVIDRLKKEIEKDQVSHSYLFEGEEAIGKKMVALSFAKALLCKEEGLEPCNRCNSCIKFDKDNHPDIELIEGKKGLISKKAIDDLIKTINIAPLESRRKIIIIDDSHDMRLEGQNGLLKTLEEPPAYVNIILITSNVNNLIPTILSRCQIVKFYPVASGKIEGLLKTNYNKTGQEAKFIAHFTKGSVGKSIQLSESPDFLERRDQIINTIHKVIKGDKTSIFTAGDFFVKNKDFIEEILDIILYWFRDLAIYKTVGECGLIINIDKIPLLSEQSFLNIDGIDHIIDDIIETRDNIQRNVNYQLAIETMLLNMQEV